MSMTRASEDFRGTDRFELRRRLGAGGMGVVYEAFDRERGRIVALKTLQRASADDLYRFKREFRALADVAHPNLVSLYELMSDGSYWFFTMELVPGVNFLAYVRESLADTAGAATNEHPTLLATTNPTGAPDSFPYDAPTRISHLQDQAHESVQQSPPDLSETTCNLPRLRAALRQLAEGVNVLHETEQLHRDIKPSNVLVTSEGRVVLLDFGLIMETTALAQQQRPGLAGTPAYMSPEQIGNQPISQASDWYNVGVILYEALTGRLPFTGTVLDVLERKQQSEPPPPRALVPSVPEDLDALCRDLLRRDPQVRPTGREVLARLNGVGSNGAPTARATQSAADWDQLIALESDQFIGRRRQLQVLDDAYAAIKDGQTAVSVYVHGMSGMGKSALVTHFLDELQRREAEVVVLKGRCYERESVPYKALDGVVDSLSKHLMLLPSEQVDELMPVDAPALARLFPVILQVGAISEVPQREQLLVEPLVLRRRAFAALRELLARLALRQPLVVFIDDLHWADADSTALLEDLLRPPDAPPLLLVASFRSEEIETKPFLKQLLQRVDAVSCRELKLQSLSAEEAGALVRSILPPNQRALDASIGVIVHEAAGNPLFIEELTRYALSSGRSKTAGLSLGEMIIARLLHQPAGARPLLETLSIAGRPLRPDVAAQATGLQDDEAPLIASLRAARFLRSGGTTQQLELYHDRIRETLATQLDSSTVQKIHRRLAETLTAKGLDDPEVLFEHFLGAGETDLAATLATLAAKRAVTALAFDRAAHFYRKAIDLAPVVGTDLLPLKIKLGEALANAGRPAEAAGVYLDAAQTAAADQALELQRRAAEQLLIGGHINEGLDVLRRVLAVIGFKLAPDAKRAMLSLLRQRAQLRLRGFKFTARPAEAMTQDELLRIDTCWAVAAGLGLVDTMRAFDFQTRHLLLALRAGDLYRIARALCTEVGFIATAGGPVERNTARMLEQAEALAHRSGHPHAQSMAVWARGISAYLVGDWANAAKLCARAAEMLREKCTGVTWELTTAHRFLFGSLLFLGEVGELSRRVPVLLAAAQEQGNLLAATDLRTRINLIWLAQDQPDEARQEVIDAMLRWPQEGFHLQHYSALLALVQIELYTGDGSVAWKHLTGQWRALTRSMLMRVQVLRIEARHLRARCALTAIISGEAHAERLFHMAESAARQIEHEQMAWARPLVALIRAGGAGLRGDLARAAELSTVAIAGFEAAQMNLYAAAARRRLGQLTSGAEGQRLMTEADAWMKAQRIKHPDRITRMLAPGFFPGAED
jgi:serine/threonine protein kinase/tetratricopeptide (TPR) repeat protein